MGQQYTTGHVAGGRQVQYGAFFALDFDPITLGANVANTAVQVPQALPFPIKIMAITALLTGTVAGSCSVNLALGTAAEAGVGTPDDSLAGIQPPDVLTNGQTLFAADQALTMTTNTAKTFYASASNAFDCIWPANGLIGVRIATGAATTGTLKITAAAIAYCRQPWRPYPTDNAWTPNANTMG